jgi:acetyl-CoA synthetase
MSETREVGLSNLSHEERRFEPPADLVASANVAEQAYSEAEADRLGFWERAAERLTWTKRWDRSSTGTIRRSRSGSSAAS